MKNQAAKVQLGVSIVRNEVLTSAKKKKKKGITKLVESAFTL